MNKSELIQKYAQEMRISKAEAARHVEGVISVVTSELAGGQNVSIADFGNFKVKKRASRRVINPQTRQEMTIPERHAVTFVVGKRLKELVNS